MDGIIKHRNVNIYFQENEVTFIPNITSRKKRLIILPLSFIVIGIVFLFIINSQAPFNLAVNDYIFVCLLSFAGYFFGIFLMKSINSLWETIYLFPPLYYGLTVAIIVIVNLLIPLFFPSDFMVSHNVKYQQITLILLIYSATLYLSLLYYIISWKRKIVIKTDENSVNSVYYDDYIIFPLRLSIKFTFHTGASEPLKLLIKGIGETKRSMDMWEPALTGNVYSYSYEEFVALEPVSKMTFILGLMDPVETEKLDAVSIVETNEKEEIANVLEEIRKITQIEIVKLVDQKITVTGTSSKSTLLEE